MLNSPLESLFDGAQVCCLVLQELVVARGEIVLVPSVALEHVVEIVGIRGLHGRHQRLPSGAR